MAGKLKAIGLALTMAVAFAVMASSASAIEHHLTGSAGDPLNVTANNEQIFTFTTGAGMGHICKKMGVNGPVPSATSTSVTVELSYSECVAEEQGEPRGAGWSITMNKCHYTFHFLTTPGNPTAGEHANTEIRCDTPEAGSGITTRVSGFSCAHTPPQTIEHAVRYQELGNGSIEITWTAHGVETTTEGVCKNKEGVGEDQRHNNGSYTGNFTLSAPNGISLNTT